MSKDNSGALPAATGEGWRCFFCDEVLRTAGDARDHFGATGEERPACRIKASERGLLRALRDAEREAMEAREALHAESADGLKAWRGAESRHRLAERSAEETGYERGMADQARSIERLRRIVHRYGDRIPMAMCHRPDWQQEIDEAMRFVADNPDPEGSQ